MFLKKDVIKDGVNVGDDTSFRYLLEEFLQLIETGEHGGEATPEFCRFVDRVKEALRERS